MLAIPLVGGALVLANTLWMFAFAPLILLRYEVPLSRPRLTPALASSSLGSAALILQNWASDSQAPPLGPAVLSLAWLSALIDQRRALLPDALTALMGFELLGLLGLWHLRGTTGTATLSVATSAALWFGVTAFAFLSRQMGLGDVKLAAVVGGLLGTLPLGLSATALILAFALAALSGRRRGRGRTTVPFGPALVTSAALTWGLGTIMPAL